MREDWKPVLSLQAVLVGLQYLFLEPNADDPLNKGKLSLHFFFCIYWRLTIYKSNPLAAAEVLRHNRSAFDANVKRSIVGGSFDGVQYDNVLAK